MNLIMEISEPIGIIQIGLDHKFKIAEENHAMLYKFLSNKYNINIYNFYREDPIPGCPFNTSATIQLYDFFSSAEKTSEKIILKIRSDVFLTKSSIDILCQEIDAIVSGEIDISYLGLYFSTEYDKICVRKDVKECYKVPDKIVIARKDKLIDNWLNTIHSVGSSTSGNVAYLQIKNTISVARMVSCQMYIVQNNFDVVDNWQIYYDWCKRYKEKSPIAVDWVLNNFDLIRTF